MRATWRARISLRDRGYAVLKSRRVEVGFKKEPAAGVVLAAGRSRSSGEHGQSNAMTAKRFLPLKLENGALASRARKPPNSGEHEGFQVASVTAGGMLVRTVRKHESLLNVVIGERFLETDASRGPSFWRSFHPAIGKRHETD